MSVYPGALAIIKLTEKDEEVILDYLATSLNIDLTLISTLLGTDALLKFLDVYAGRTIKVPNRESLMKSISYCRIYSYCKSRNNSEESLERASKIFGLRKANIKSICERIEKQIGDINGKQ